MRVRLSLRTPKPSTVVRHDWRAFSANPELQARYTAEFRDLVHLQDVKEEPGAGYTKVMDAHKAATARCVPVMEKSRGPARSKHPDVVAARQRVEEARRAYDQEPSTEQREPEERVTTWLAHFSNLLGTHQTVEGAEREIPAVLEDLNINDGPFTTEEFAKVKAYLRQGKSAGPDGIPPEVIKNCNLDDVILEICNQALMESNMPEIWSLSHIIPVPKSGDLSKPDNYRGISLTCIIAKNVQTHDTEQDEERY